jgi:SulP family sulfate permease
MFRPKLIDTLKNYSAAQFRKDAMSGVIVGIVALPLAIAFAIASGVSPDKGLVTAVIAGFLISALGGSKVQIGGPTGAFIVIVYGIVQQHGVSGLIIATFIAGIILVAMGLAKMGAIIKFIPHSLIVGFTSGIALIIFSSQMRDFFGLQMGAVPSDFIEKWMGFGKAASSFSWQALALAAATVAIVQLWPKFTHKIPGSLIAIFATTLVAVILKLPVETIDSRFGNIPTSLPMPQLPAIDYATLKALIAPAFTIALLGGIESLLSAVVADGMTGGRHRSNTELIAQGIANMASGLFGGIPATGAIARTATNVKNGGRTPIAGIIHAITLLLIMIFFSKWAALIPMATLAGILVVIAWHMSEWESFIDFLKGPKTDVVILLTTFLLTVLVDLTVAIEIGMVLASLLFMRNMIKATNVQVLSAQLADAENEEYADDNRTISLPNGVEVFELSGPLFFGAAYKFKDAIRVIEHAPKALILRMRFVPIIDATGIRTLDDVITECGKRGTKILLSEVRSQQVYEELKKARLIFKVGKGNIFSTIEAALHKAATIH